LAGEAQLIAVTQHRARALSRILREWRSTILSALALAGAVASVACVYEWRMSVADNRTIAALRDGRDAAVALSARTELLLARTAFLTLRADVDLSRAYVEAIERRDAPHSAAQARYLLGNALLRKGFELIEKGNLDAAGPYINLARRDYRRALQFYPEHWDTKFNLDVAARLIRDFPQFDAKGGDELYADPKKLWTDIPRAPKGLP
jgi:mxaK protein